MPRREKVLFWLSLFGAMLFSAVARSQAPELVESTEPAKEAVSTGLALGLSVFELLSPVLTVLIGWIAVKLNSFLSTKIKNETLAGVVARFSDSVFVAVKKVNQTLRDEIVAAKKPGSAGGSKITPEEASKLRAAVWEELKSEYGGMVGLSKVLGILKLEEASLAKWVDNRIEAAVHDTGLAKKAAGNPT